VYSSITGRLVALFAITTASILILSGVFLRGMLSMHLARGSEQFLSDELDTLRAVQEEHHGDLDALREEIGFESDVSHFSHYHARILQAGQVLLETPGMADILPESVFPPPDARELNPLHAGPLQAPAVHPGALGHATVHGTSFQAMDGRPYLLVSAVAPFGSGPEPGRILQLAVETSNEAGLIARYEKDMLLVVLVGTLSSALAGWFIARRGLAPLRDIANRARKITVSQLHERVGSTQWPAELKLLATAFDEMLGRLEQSFTRLSQFSADLAHELRTPINNLMGEAEVALTRSRAGGDYRHVLESSLEELGRLSRMIDGLLFLARAENVETPINPVLLDARAELETIREFYEALAVERGVRLASAGKGHVFADPILFQRAVSNLISNALNHTPAGGDVMLSVQETEAALEVSVQDTGCGVADQHLPRLFDRFYRVDGARSRGYGTGLGLALVKSIIDLHRGSVQVESQPGQGMTVRLRFPCSPAGAAS
jgi:two-component system heavy metal sensor histidine kinase CusS